MKIYDGNGKVYGEYGYTAWGKCRIKTNINGIGEINPFRYRGYYYDEEISLYYLNARYYDPEVGRFISADSMEYLSPESINGLNLYAYCGNNPVMNMDPTGTSLIAFFVILAMGAIVGGVVGGKVAYDNGARGWSLLGGIVLGMTAGIAVAGALIAVGAAFAGAFGASTIFGVAIKQVFAIGALAYNGFAVLVAPLLGIEIELIDWGQEYKPERPNRNPLPEHPGYKNPYGKPKQNHRNKNYFKSIQIG